jgi:argininosuccinate lyase
MTLWHARMGAAPAEVVWELSASISFDRRLAPFDLAGSAAHVKGLARAGIVTSEEEDALLAALRTAREELEEGRFSFEAEDEDVHTAIERRVTELAGATGQKLHTGRSRNDQVATALRLWLRFELPNLAAALLRLQEVLAKRAVDAADAYMPGYTHLQRAQPVMVAHHLLAHGWALARDVQRLFACFESASVSPLGAGALAGSSLPLDPDATAADLGFSRRFENSLDAVSDRDFVAEALFALALAGVHLSRIGEELVVWSSEEFGFVTLADEYATGSSMLPQKKNPDVAELARGKAGRLIGNLTGMLATLKGLPLSYNRDLQEDKEPLFDAVDQVARIAAALTGAMGTLSFDFDAMKAAADQPYSAAVDVAEWLVEHGTPFREAHQVVASLVRESLAGGESLPALVARHPLLGEEAARLFAPGEPVRRRTTPGGAGPVPLRQQADHFARSLEEQATRLEEIATMARVALKLLD